MPPTLAHRSTSRRAFLGVGLRASLLAAAGMTPAWPAALTPLEVAYAGSMTSLMEGGIKTAVARSLALDFRGRAQGASALAELIAGGSLRPDVFIAVTPGPMRIVLNSGKASSAIPIAHTAMVIAYSPGSRFAPQFARAPQPGADPWWRLLQLPGLRFGRSDPRSDPQGRNIIFVCELAERLYHQPGLSTRILGPTLNPRQIFSEATLEARLQSGQLDAAAAYKIQPAPFHLPYLALPPEINLGATLPPSAAAAIALRLGHRTFRPEPLVYYAAALNHAPHPRSARAFLHWLQSPAALATLHRYGYDPPPAASPLTA